MGMLVVVIRNFRKRLKTHAVLTSTILFSRKCNKYGRIKLNSVLCKNWSSGPTANANTHTHTHTHSHTHTHTHTHTNTHTHTHVSYKLGTIGKHHENRLYLENVFSLSTIMIDTQMQMKYPVSSPDDIWRQRWWCYVRQWRASENVHLFIQYTVFV